MIGCNSFAITLFRLSVVYNPLDIIRTSFYSPKTSHFQSKTCLKYYGLLT